MTERRLCIAGKNEIAAATLEAAVARLGAERVRACPNRGDDGSTGWQPSLRRVARELGVETLELEAVMADPDLVFLSLEYDRIVRPDAFASDRLYNLHFSRLPAYKGMYAAAWPILDGAEISGVTLHEIDAGIDTGDVLDRRDLPLAPDETARSLYFRCMAEGAALAQAWLDRLLADPRPPARPQGAAGSSYRSKRSIDYAALKIDLVGTAEEVSRRLRAFHFREYQIPRIEGVPVTGPEILPARSRARPGTARIAGEEIVLATVDYDLRLRRDRSGDWRALAEAGDAAAIRAYPHGTRFIDAAGSDGWTPLIVAAYAGRRAVCEALLDAGADPERGNPNGTTPLMYAKEHGERTGDFSVCRLLLDRGADPRARDRFGRNVIDYARRNGQKKAIDFFGQAYD